MEIKYKSNRVIDHVATGRSAYNYRRQNYLRQFVVAKKAGMPQSRLSQLEWGKRKWTQDTFDRITKAINALSK